MGTNGSIQMTREEYSRHEAELNNLKGKLDALARERCSLGTHNSNIQDPTFDEFEHERFTIQSRINEMSRILGRAKIIISEESNGVVHLGSQVTVEIDDEVLDMQIVSVINNLDGVVEEVSIDSPLGKEIIGKRVGSSFSYDVGGNSFFVKVLNVT